MDELVLRTGDIITASIPSLPFIPHKGILVIINGKGKIYHNTPTLCNVNGGNIVSQPIEDFLKGREILNIEPTGFNSDYINAKTYPLKNKPFDLFSFNCLDYINNLKN